MIAVREGHLQNGASTGDCDCSSVDTGNCEGTGSFQSSASTGDCHCSSK